MLTKYGPRGAAYGISKTLAHRRKSARAPGIAHVLRVELHFRQFTSRSGRSGECRFARAIARKDTAWYRHLHASESVRDVRLIRHTVRLRPPVCTTERMALKRYFSANALCRQTYANKSVFLCARMQANASICPANINRHDNGVSELWPTFCGSANVRHTSADTPTLIKTLLEKIPLRSSYSFRFPRPLSVVHCPRY